MQTWSLWRKYSLLLRNATKSLYCKFWHIFPSVWPSESLVDKNYVSADLFNDLAIFLMHVQKLKANQIIHSFNANKTMFTVRKCSFSIKIRQIRQSELVLSVYWFSLWIVNILIWQHNQNNHPSFCFCTAAMLIKGSNLDLKHVKLAFFYSFVSDAL